MSTGNQPIPLSAEAAEAMPKLPSRQITMKELEALPQPPRPNHHLTWEGVAGNPQFAGATLTWRRPGATPAGSSSIRGIYLTAGEIDIRLTDAPDCPPNNSDKDPRRIRLARLSTSVVLESTGEGTDCVDFRSTPYPTSGKAMDLERTWEFELSPA